MTALVFLRNYCRIEKGGARSRERRYLRSETKAFTNHQNGPNSALVTLRLGWCGAGHCNNLFFMNQPEQADQADQADQVDQADQADQVDQADQADQAGARAFTPPRNPSGSNRTSYRSQIPPPAPSRARRE